MPYFGYTCIILSERFVGNLLKELELICLHTVKWFQVLYKSLIINFFLSLL